MSSLSIKCSACVEISYDGASIIYFGNLLNNFNVFVQLVLVLNRKKSNFLVISAHLEQFEIKHTIRELGIKVDYLKIGLSKKIQYLGSPHPQNSS